MYAEVVSDKEQSLQVRFYNASGMLLSQQTQAVQSGKNSFSLNTSADLHAGKLYVRFSGAGIDEINSVIIR